MKHNGPGLGDRYALRGIRVTDFTWVQAGPAATRVLADHSAEVIKIESDFAYAPGGGASANTPTGVGYRHNWNAGKLSITLYMNTVQGLDIARRLVAVSDVVAENFSGRVMTKWGLDYQSLRQIRPDIIMLSMSGPGRTGPWKDYVTFGQTLQAWSGITYLTGFQDTDPCGPASAYSDCIAGNAGAHAVLLALIHRARTGEGQWIDMAQLDANCVLMETLVLDQSANMRGDAMQRTGNRLPHGGAAPHGAYRCRVEDRWVAIAVFTNDEWKALARAMGDPAWAHEERFRTATGRQRHADDLDRLVETWTTQHSPEDVMHRLQAAGVAAGVVQTGPDMLDRDPQLEERGLFLRVPDSQGTLRSIEGTPYKLSRTPGGAVRAAPDYGAHQDYVLRDILGMSDDEIAECAIAGAFE